MRRLIKSALYRRDDHSHDHQDPDMAKAALIDAGLNRILLLNAGDALANKIRSVLPNSPKFTKELQDWENAK